MDEMSGGLSWRWAWRLPWWNRSHLKSYNNQAESSLRTNLLFYSRKYLKIVETLDISKLNLFLTISNNKTGLGKIAQQVKVFTIMPEDLSSIPWTARWTIRCDSYKLFSDLSTWSVSYACPCVHKNKCVNKYMGVNTCYTYQVLLLYVHLVKYLN